MVKRKWQSADYNARNFMFPGNDNNESWVKICCLSTAILCKVVFTNRTFLALLFIILRNTANLYDPSIKLNGPEKGFMELLIGLVANLIMRHCLQCWQQSVLVVISRNSTPFHCGFCPLCPALYLGHSHTNLCFRDVKFWKFEFYLYENYFLKLFLMKFTAVQC